MSDNLASLADRVEALSGPCRETDADIAEACGLAPDGWMRVKGGWIHREGVGSRSAPKFTASLDAAMSLVPEGAVTANLLHKAIDQCFAHWRTDTDAMFRKRLPLYVTAAALRARSQQVSDKLREVGDG